MQAETGYRLEVATVRKLETEADAFSFGDKLIEKWYENVDRGSNKGVLVVVTSGKDGAVTGGPKFLKVCLACHCCVFSWTSNQGLSCRRIICFSMLFLGGLVAFGYDAGSIAICSLPLAPLACCCTYHGALCAGNWRRAH